jgi:hypothetical protein
MRRCRLGVVLAVLVGCGGAGVPDDVAVPADDAGGTGMDAEAPRDGAVADAPAADVARADTAAPADARCAPGTLTPPPWLETYERETLAALTGAADIVPGVRLHERSTAASRDYARNYLRDRLTALGLAVEIHNYGTGANVIATLPATIAPGTRRVVMGAHFDGVLAGPAAADNGTGTTLVVAAARWLSTAFPCRTRDVVFALFDEEELGLRGSRAYVRRAMDERVPIDAAHLFDMLSWDMDGDRVIEIWVAPPALLLPEWRASATAHGASMDARMFAGSDHTAFVEQGINAVGLCEEFHGGDTNPNYHRATDAFDLVNFTYLGTATTVAIDVVARELGAL